MNMYEVVKMIASRSFWCGMIIYACCLSLYQDYLGQDEWIARIRDGWVDSQLTVPCAIIILVMTFRFLFSSKGYSRKLARLGDNVIASAFKELKNKNIDDPDGRFKAAYEEVYGKDEKKDEESE